MKIAWLFVWLTLPLLIVVPVYLHGGGLDAQGCHHDRKDGGYIVMVLNPPRQKQRAKLSRA